MDVNKEHDGREDEEQKGKDCAQDVQNDALHARLLKQDMSVVKPFVFKVLPLF